MNLWPLVAASGDLPWPPRTPDEVARFVERATQEALLPILFAAPPAIDGIGQALAARRALDAAHRHRVAAISRAIASLPALLQEDFILLKGADYAFRLYPAPHLRPMADVDVLVRREHVAAVASRLSAAGMRRNFTRLTQLYPGNYDLGFDLGDVTLEVHRALAHRTRARIDEEALWRDRVACTVAGVATSRLSDSDAFLFSVLNIVKEDLATPLLRYLDLWMMLRRNPALAGEAAALARRWRLVNGFDAVLHMLNAMFPDLGLPRRERALFDRFVVPARAAITRDRRRFRRAAQLWRKYWLIDGVDQRIAYAAELAAAVAYGWLHRGKLNPIRRK